MEYTSVFSLSWKSQLKLLCMAAVSMSLLAACGPTQSQTGPASQATAVTGTATPDPSIVVSPTAVATATTPAHEPTYVVYSRAVDATAVAIVTTIPTPSLIPNLRPDLQTQEKQSYLWHIANATAVALVPTLPPSYDPLSERAPQVILPYPTDTPYPFTPTTNGKIYNRSLEDRPEGKELGEVNYWVGHIRGLRIDVFAGHAVGGPSRGIIVVETELTGTIAVDAPTYRTDEYLTPSQVGAVRIINEAGGTFTLQAADGSYFYFDIDTRQWLSPTPGPSPSVTISPVPPVSPAPTQQP